MIHLMEATIANCFCFRSLLCIYEHLSKHAHPLFFFRVLDCFGMRLRKHCSPDTWSFFLSSQTSFLVKKKPSLLLFFFLFGICINQRFTKVYMLTSTPLMS